MHLLLVTARANKHFHPKGAELGGGKTFVERGNEDSDDVYSVTKANGHSDIRAARGSLLVGPELAEVSRRESKDVAA